MATSQKKNTKGMPQAATEMVNDVLGGITNDGLKGVIGNASKIVFKAAGILEEEIAKGIIAAKQIEEKYTDVPKIKAGKSMQNQEVEQLLLRFRKDAHDIVDLILDFASIAASNVERLSGQLISIKQEGAIGVTGTEAVPPAAPQMQVPLIRVQKPLKPGEQTDMPLELQNDNLQQVQFIEIVNTAFTSSDGMQMPGNILSFSPNPFNLNPGEKITINCTITIPPNAVTGNYTSFVEGKGMQTLKATLMVTVS
jgi:hypothetical protein